MLYELKPNRSILPALFGMVMFFANRLCRSLGAFLILFSFLFFAETSLAAKPTSTGKTQLSAPLDFSATAISTTAIKLNWVRPNTGETDFEIEKSLYPTSGFSKVATLSATTTSYTSSGLTPATKIYYRARTIGKGKKVSIYSSVVSATTDSGGAPADTTDPSVSVTPSTNQTYTSNTTVAISASASDNIAVTKVEFWDGSTRKYTDTKAPYSYSWGFSETSNGSHTWTAKAFDAAGNSKTDSVTLTVAITSSDTAAPTVSISPATNQTYTSNTTVAISASASDNIAVTKVEFWDGSTRKYTDTKAPYSYSWGFSETSNGSHTWTAKAFDAAGNSKTDSVTLTVAITSSDTTAPTVSISPATNQTYTSASTVSINASTSDNVAVTKVEFWDGSTRKYTDTKAPYSYSWGFSETSNGSHTWTAKAFDAAGNSKIDSVTLTVDIDTTDPTTPGEGAYIWQKRFGSTSSDRGYGVATDKQTGDIAMTGAYSNTVDFGGGSLSCSSTGNAVVAMYDANGSHLWSECVAGTAGTVTSQGIDIDSNGSVVVTGYFKGTVSFSGQSFTSAAGTDDAFIAKYSASGVLQWVRQLTDTAGTRGLGIAVDSHDNVVVSGFYQNPDEIILVKFSPTGGLQWIKQFAGAGLIEGRDIVVDSNDNIIMTGSFSGSMDFGGGVLSTTPIWRSDLFIAKFTSSGVHIWSNNFGGDNPETASSIAVDPGTDEIVVTGYSSSKTIDLGGSILDSYGNGNNDIFIAKYAPNGTHRWSKIIGGIGGDYGKSVAIDDNGDVVLGGYFEGSVDFGGGSLTSAGSFDIYLVKYSAAGQHIWSQRQGGTVTDLLNNIAISPIGEISVVGQYNGVTDLGGGPMSSAGSYDILLSTYEP